MTVQAGLADRLEAVREHIATSAASVGRDHNDIALIVVTKFHPASLVRDLAQLGVRDVGENRHPEARDKRDETLDLNLAWHFIGQLQRNKAAQVASYADAIHSIDRPELVAACERADRGSGRGQLEVFLQLNLTEDEGRGGVDDAGLIPLAEQVLASPALRLRGLMAVAGLDADPRSEFARVAAASQRLQSVAPEATALSMGMSGDMDAAIAEGATHLRIGTAITGNRPTSP